MEKLRMSRRMTTDKSKRTTVEARVKIKISKNRNVTRQKNPACPQLHYPQRLFQDVPGIILHSAGLHTAGAVCYTLN